MLRKSDRYVYRLMLLKIGVYCHKRGYIDMVLETEYNSTLSEADTFVTDTVCPSYRESNKIKVGLNKDRDQLLVS